MALTPEDVVNKRFQPTKFREGYDQDEVDDFLDEVVVELRRLNKENEELRERLEASPAAPEGSAAAEDEAPAASTQPVAASTAAVPVAAATATTTTPAPVSSSSIEEEAESTTNLLTLARRLHEEHVREGAEKRDALIADGQAQAARIVAEAEAKQREILAETESKQRQRTAVLEQERTQIETKIDDLRSFERDYRSRLKNYIQTQLHELDAASSGEESAPASAPSVGSN